MKNRLIALVCATMLSVCCLGLAACGNSSSGSASETAGSAEAASASTEEATAASSEAADPAAASSEEASPEAADPAAKFVGDWKLAGAQFSGITLAGDFSQLIDTGSDIAFTINEGGTASASYDGGKAELTWVAKDDNTITLTRVESAESSSESSEGLMNSTTMDAMYRDDMLVIDSETDEGTVSVLFSHDGKMAGMPAVVTSEFKPVTDGSSVVGTWSLAAATYMGATMYGDMSALSQYMGTDSTADLNIVLNEDGTAKLFGSDGTWTVDENGLMIGDSTAMLQMMSFGDMLALDMSELMGTEIVMIFSKQ